MDTSITTLETQRLILRPFTLDDAATVQALAGVPEIARTVAGIPHPYPDGLAAAWIATHGAAAARGDLLTWAMTRRADDAVIGAISLTLTAEHARAGLGYWLGVPFWKQGYATEAATRIVDYGFSVLSLHRIEALCLPSNTGSIRVLEKAGFQLEGTLRGYVQKWCAFEDRAIYGCVRTS